MSLPHSELCYTAYVFKLKATGSTGSPCPILDYAVQILKRSPESLICVTFRSAQNTSQEYTCRNCTLTNRRTLAVASYFEQRGISASRLGLLGSGSPRSLKQNFEVVQLDLASKAD